MSNSQWLTPVTDRTQHDVDYAIEKLKFWKEQMASGIIPETFELKGTLNPTDLNRIEGNISYLFNYLRTIGYDVSVITKDWNYTSLFMSKDSNRIIRNIKYLYLQCFAQLVVNYPTSITKYEEVNLLENLILNFKDYASLITGSYKKCGVYKCGVYPRTATIGSVLNSNMNIAYNQESYVYSMIKCGDFKCVKYPSVATIGVSINNAIDINNSYKNNQYTFPICGTKPCGT